MFINQNMNFYWGYRDFLKDHDLKINIKSLKITSLYNRNPSTIGVYTIKGYKYGFIMKIWSINAFGQIVSW